jgi:uncharacterized protein (TIGR00269 family)
MESKSKRKKKCSRCKKEAVTELRYSKEALCKSCFMEFFERRVRKTIRTNSLLDARDKTAVALSGGKDSAVVLYILHGLSKKAPKSELVAISIDQGIGDFQKKGLAAAKKLCRTLGVAHHIYSYKDELGVTMDEIMDRAGALENAAPACSYCGVLRRRILNQKAKELGVTKIATGHNMDDEIQAGMMNFIRGDLERIARMGAYVGVVKDERFVPRIKPLRDCPEDEVRLYAELKELPFVPVRCPYSGEAYRKTVREAIETIDERHPGSKFQMLKSIDRLIELMRKEKTGKIGRCATCGEPSSQETCKFCEIRKKLGID